MTQARMVELKNLLEDAGWTVFGSPDKDKFFSVSNDQITWKLLNRSGKEFDLVFFLFDYRGASTTKLSDVSVVEEKSTAISLDFAKINTETWKSGVRKFVKNLYFLL
ncbi:hypothetical protein [Caballeronia sp. LZ035]|uniref:hypothetical protein n=1 Tax=Caballeronia sp. LZ035 TaxID=3038568 RepID=UPI002864A5EB|nr:hypothetical protein [Caballeronia sp. LZ035]MDR5759999.1 hypothetical protein [Caballeronia sp. LZ035]